jgi:hypothetical protein
MEITQNRYNVDRVIEKIDSNRLRIMGESLFVRTSHDDNKNLTMFDFEGGPCLNVGGTIKYKGTQFKIKSIKQEESRMEYICSILIEVSL